MDSVQQPQDVTEEQVCTAEPTVVVEEKDGVFRVILRGLLYPFHIVVRVYRGFWWVLGFRQSKQKALVHPTSSPRQSLIGRKRIHPFTRLLLHVVPRWLQGALGFPVSHNIGRTLSPEIRVSPTKPHGKGSKRKQDDIDDDDDDEEDEQTWVDVLNQDLGDEDEGPDQDPDYEPGSMSTESEEYCSQNNTQSDIEVQEKGVVIIEDVNTDVQLAASPEEPAV